MAGCGFRPRSKGTFGERVHSSGAARRRSSCRVAHAHARREPQDAAKCSALRIPHAHTHTRAAPTRCGEPEYARLQPPSHTMRCAHRRQHQVQPPAATVGPAAGGRYRRGGPGDCPRGVVALLFPPRPSGLAPATPLGDASAGREQLVNAKASRRGTPLLALHVPWSPACVEQAKYLGASGVGVPMWVVHRFGAITSICRRNGPKAFRFGAIEPRIVVIPVVGSCSQLVECSLSDNQHMW